jgi:hypothetical protein
MENIAKRAATRGRSIEVDLEDRWPDDTGVVKRETTNDDKLRNVRSLEELREKLADGTDYSSWDINSAFRRAVEGRSFEDIEPLLAQYAILCADERTVTYAATLSLELGAGIANLST